MSKDRIDLDYTHTTISEFKKEEILSIKDLANFIKLEVENKF